MSEDHDHGKYLTDEATVEKLYGFLKDGQPESAAAHLKGLGEDQVVVQTWIGAQCDINNVKHDPVLSEKLALIGIDYCLEKGYRKAAAMMLHNVAAFYMPNWDEGVDPDAIPRLLDAARRQVPLRKEIPEGGPYGWSLWDLGMAELVAGNLDESVWAFEEGIRQFEKDGDKDGAAWCRLFIGKAKIKHAPDLKSEGETEMLAAAKIIMEIGADWEKDSVGAILEGVGLKLE